MSKIRWQGTMSLAQIYSKLRGKRAVFLDRQSLVSGTHGLAQEVRKDASVELLTETGMIDTGVNLYEVKTGTIDERATIDEANRLAQAGHFDVLVIPNVKRYFRDEMAAWKALEPLFVLGIWVIFVADDIIVPVQRDWQSKFGGKATEAANEVRELSYKLKGTAAKKVTYKLAIGSPKYGLRHVPSTFVNENKPGTFLHTFDWDDTPHPTTGIVPSAAIPQIIQWWIEGDHSDRSLTDKIRKLGHPVGIRFVQDALRNPICIGKARKNITPARIDAKGRATKPHGRNATYELIDIGIEARVPKEWYDQVQADLRYRETIDPLHKKRNRTGIKARSLFVKVAKCMRCGGGFSQMGWGDVEGRRVVRLRHDPIADRGCFVYTVSERVPEREFYLWLAAFDQPADKTLQKWIDAFVRAYQGRSSEEVISRRRELERDIENLNYLLMEARTITQVEHARRLGEFRRQIGELERNPNAPTEHEFLELRDGRRIFGDPTVAPEAQGRFITSLFDELAFRPPAAAHVGPGRPRAGRYEGGVINFQASKVRALYLPLVFACQTPKVRETKLIVRPGVCFNGASGGATAATAHYETPRGYESFAAVIDGLVREPELAAA